MYLTENEEIILNSLEEGEITDLELVDLYEEGYISDEFMDLLISEGFIGQIAGKALHGIANGGEKLSRFIRKTRKIVEPFDRKIVGDKFYNAHKRFVDKDLALGTVNRLKLRKFADRISK